MKVSPSLLLIPALYFWTAGAAVADFWSTRVVAADITTADSGAATPAIRATLPATLAKSIAQGALGRPSASGDSRVVLTPKPDLEARAQVRMKRVPPLLLNESSLLFGLKLDAPFHLDLRFFDLKTEGDVRVRSVHFDEGRKGDDSVEAAIELELRHVRVNAREAWVRELGLTPDPPLRGENADLEAASCRTRKDALKDALDDFAQGRLAARVRRPGVTRKSVRDGANPIRVKAKFRVSLDRELDSERKESPLHFALLEVSHDVESVIEKHYRLDADLEVPPVFVRIGGACFPGDTSGISAIFEELKEPLKVLIARSMHEDLIRIALRESTKAFASLALPTGKEWVVEKEAPWANVFRNGLESRADATRVRRARVILAPDAEAKRRSSEVGVENSKLLDSLLWSFHQRVSLTGISAGRKGELHLRFEDATELNARVAPRLAAYPEGKLFAQDQKHLRAVVNRAFFESKLDLLSMLRWEQSLVVPSGVRLAEDGFASLPSSDGGLKLRLPVEVLLGKLPGLVGVGADLLERFAGNTGGILRLPLVLSVRPSIAAVSSSSEARFVVLELKLEMDSSASNLDRSNALIEREVRKKLTEFSEKVEKLQIRIPLIQLDGSPLRLERVFFSDEGALVADFSLSPIRDLLQKNRKAKEGAR